MNRTYINVMKDTIKQWRNVTWAFIPYDAPSIEEQLDSARELSNEFEGALMLAIDGLQWVVTFKGDAEMMLKAAESALEKLKKFDEIIVDDND